jgi:FAD/FMN-containing dehydrogenase
MLGLDASRTRRLYSTYSNIARLPSVQRAAVLDEIDPQGRMNPGKVLEL